MGSGDWDMESYDPGPDDDPPVPPPAVMAHQFEHTDQRELYRQNVVPEQSV